MVRVDEPHYQTVPLGFCRMNGVRRAAGRRAVGTDGSPVGVRRGGGARLVYEERSLHYLLYRCNPLFSLPHAVLAERHHTIFDGLVS